MPEQLRIENNESKDIENNEPSAEAILQLLRGDCMERAKARRLLGFFDEQKMLSSR